MGELALDDLDERLLQRIIRLVYQFTKINMTERKENLIRSRLRPRLRELGFTSFESYVDYLENHPEEGTFFINQVTTNETSFFRTPRIWSYFEEDFLKNWKRENTLNIWSAAASTGEEAWSISMKCLENGVTNYKILGTDISTKVLDVAREGFYSGKTSVDFLAKAPQLCEKYFEKYGDAIRVRPSLKEKVKFAPQNLFEPLQNPQMFDIIFLRNVLIYFKNEDQLKVILNVTKHLKPGGILVLGESESLTRFDIGLKFKCPLIYVHE